MSNNAIGTIIIASGLIISLLIGWFLFLTFIYFVFTIIFNITFKISSAIVIFIAILTLKSFYPKNVFL